MTTITPASCNVFADLGFDAEEALNRKLRSQPMMEIDRFLHDRRLTQQQAAELLGVQQSRGPDLGRGKIDRFSVDTLVSLLGKTGQPSSASGARITEGVKVAAWLRLSR